MSPSSLLPAVLSLAASVVSGQVQTDAARPSPGGGRAADGGASARAGSLRIRHEPIDCVLAERYPLVDACFEPSAVEEARVHFRADGSVRWHFVEMRPVGQCYRGTLPPPLASTRRILYYVSARGADAAAAGTPVRPLSVVTDEKSCAAGAVGPFLSSATVQVGGGASPSGFAGMEGAVSHTAKRVVAAIVGGGAVGAGVALAGLGSGDDGGTGGTATTTTEPGSPVTTSTTIIAPPTTQPPASTTTTTTRPPTTTTTLAPTTTTTTSPAPTTTTTAPPAPTTTTTTTAPPPTTTTTTAPPPTTTTTTTAPPPTTTTTTAPPPTTTTTTAPPPTTTTTTQPPPTTTTTTAPPPTTTTTTAPPPNTTTTTTEPPPTTTTTTAPPPTTTLAPAPLMAPVLPADGADKPELRSSRLGARERGRAAPVGPWTSELAVAGGRGQLVVNGGELGYAAAGRSELGLALRSGLNRIEAVLVDAESGGTWTFAFPSAVRPGTLRVLAGDVTAISPLAVSFALRGRPGERVVFTVEGL